MGFLCRHCGNTFERLERMEMHSERCWKANKADTFCNCLMMLGVECDCLKQCSELNKKLLNEKQIKEKQMSDKKHGNMLIDLFNEFKKIQDIVDEYSPSDDKSGEETEDKEGDTVEDVMSAEPRKLSLEELASIEEIKEVGNDFYAMLHSLGDSREIEMAKLKLEECVMWAVKGICNND